MDDRLPTRAELEAPYRHPYRTYVPLALKQAEMGKTAVVGGVGTAALVAFTFSTGNPAWTVLAAIVALTTALVVLRWALEGARVVRTLTKDWDRPSELGSVRAARPHAHEADPELLHPEFAVTVEEDGYLRTWRFLPLAVDQYETGGEEVYVPGRPRYAAKIVEKAAFDTDASTAAAQLADAQAQAAVLERLARERARAELLEAETRLALEQETSSTAAALQHLTGQRKPPRR